MPSSPCSFPTTPRLRRSGAAYDPSPGMRSSFAILAFAQPRGGCKQPCAKPSASESNCALGLVCELTAFASSEARKPARQASPTGGTRREDQSGVGRRERERYSRGYDSGTSKPRMIGARPKLLVAAFWSNVSSCRPPLRVTALVVVTSSTHPDKTSRCSSTFAAGRALNESGREDAILPARPRTSRLTSHIGPVHNVRAQDETSEVGHVIVE